MGSISVLMPVFNAERFLYESVQSVLCQTHSELALILINDGSTDSSHDILLKIASIDKRVKVISQENQGIVAALNTGIEHAQGDYVARMDADDICYPDRFAKQLQFMERHSLDLCGSAIEFIGRGTGKRMYPETHDELFINLMTYGKTLAHPTVLAKSEVFKKFHYSSDYKDAEDLALWLDIAFNSDFKMGNYQEALLKYRVHEQQVSKEKKASQLDSTDRAISDFISQQYNEITCDELQANSFLSRPRKAAGEEAYQHHLSYLVKLKKVTEDKNITSQFFDHMLLRICRKGVAFQSFPLDDYLDLMTTSLTSWNRFKLKAKAALKSSV
ncbi:glycosyltransferase family 2 protein [Endozoicomonas acroporae]|uniref:glycosyltransferase family 2 protein n=1 Tax=Endozoicomonas acroporae TaxID=1701104 RepID=UPI003D7A48BA